MDDLANIAQELDAQERAQMFSLGTETADAIRYAAEESGNVDDAGNFSVQVLGQAIERSHSLELSYIDPSKREGVLQDGVDTQEAFVCNQAAHWLTIRRIADTWWNLNSINDGPERISDFFLSAFLIQLSNEGYSIFLVKGSLPRVRTIL